MATIITYPSALEYWLSDNGIPYHYHFDRYSSKVKNKEILHSETSREEICRSIEMLHFSLPVHVAVPNHIKRSRSETAVFHRLQNPLPDYSFHKVSDSIFIASPELCFIQAAAELSVPELVLLANELCAIYIKDETEEFGQRRRDPVTTTNSISAYINKAGQIRGIQKARTAIRYALDRSNSPLESRLAVLATLPLSWGGYGLLKPELNAEIILKKRAADYLGRTSCFCDMVWKKQRIILEYDSNLTHLAPRQHARDKKRATALSMSGYKVISATADNIRNFSSIESLFLHVRDELNMRTHKDRLDAYYDQRWLVVHQILLQKNKQADPEDPPAYD